MMNINDIEFNDDLEMNVAIPTQEKDIRLVIADYLDLAEEDISDEYKDKIVKMLDSSVIWYKVAQQRIFSELSIYGELMAIYLLSEQNTSNDFIIGLLFRIESDIEHGRGMKISLNKMEVLDYGLADIAFC